MPEFRLFRFRTFRLLLPDLGRLAHLPAISAPLQNDLFAPVRREPL